MIFRKLIVLFILTPLFALGQHFPIEKEVSFEQLEMDFILQTERDTSGFLWVRTESTIYRYDGKYYAKFYSGNGVETPSVLHANARGEIYVGTTNGEVLRFSGKAFEKIHSDTSKGSVLDFFEFRDTIATVYRNGQISLPQSEANVVFQAPVDFIYCIALFEEQLYLGTDHGLYAFDFLSSSPDFKAVDYKRGRSQHIVTALKASNDELLVGHYDGSFSQLKESNTYFFPGRGRSAIRSIVSTGEFIWLGTHADGLFAVSQHIDSTFHLPEIEEKRITHLYFDVENNLWANSNRAVYRIDPLVEFWNCPLSNVQAFISEEHMMWAGTSDGFYMGNTSDCYEPINEGLNVASLCISGENIYVGTLGKGLYVYSKTGKLQAHFDERQGLRNLNIMDICFSNERLYLATLGGVYVSDTTVQSFEKIDNQSQFIYALIEDRAQNLWVGTDGNGLQGYQKDDNGHRLFFSVLDGESVIAMAQQPEGPIYAATAQNNIYIVSGDSVRLIDAHIPIDYGVMGLYFNRSDELMIWTEKGLWIYRTHRERVISLSQYNSFWDIPTAINGSFRDQNDRFWVSNDRGIYELHADKQFCSGQNLFEISNANMNSSENLSNGSQWRHTMNTAQFSFSQLNFNSDCKYEFEYRLVGFVDEWSQTADYKVIYPALPDGSYRFELRQVVPGGGPRSEVRSIDFVILKPWFRSWWFYAITILGLAAIVFAIIMQRERNLVARNQRERDKIRAQFELLKNQVNPHFLFNSFNTLTDMVEQNSSEAVPYIEKLSDLFRNILAYRKKELITVAEEMKIVRNYIDLQKHRFAEGLQIEVDLSDEVLQSYIPPLTMQLLIENAMKHNSILPNKPLRIEISSNAYVISVKNNLNKKIESPQEGGTGYGLSSIVERYRFFTKVDVAIRDNDGEFIVELPLILNA